MKKLRREPPEKKKRKTKNSSPPPSPPSFSSLPDEITVNCLARIPRPYYPRLSIVSKSFHSLLSSTELYAERSHIGSTEKCLYVCLRDGNSQISQWFTLWINPNRTLPDSSVIKKKKKKQKKKKKKKKKNNKTIRQLLVPIPPSNFPSVSNSNTIVTVGSEIYVIGGLVDGAPSSAVRILDCRSHTWRDAPSMNVARKNASSCFYDGKIYVLGGCKGLEEDEPWAEVFDTKTQTWEHLPDPGAEIRECEIFRIAEIEGKIEFGNLMRMYAYDTKQGKWEKCENKTAFMRSGCVVENVSYFYSISNIISGCDGRNWIDVKGLDSLADKCMKNMPRLVSCGGRILFFREEWMEHSKKIWCAEIVLEKRDGGEVWGKIEWDDVVLTIPISRYVLRCLAVSV